MLAVELKNFAVLGFVACELHFFSSTSLGISKDYINETANPRTRKHLRDGAFRTSQPVGGISL
jgi:hypothetical protein